MVSAAVRIPGSESVLDPNTKRHVHLDIIRVLAVCFVAVDHGYKEYSVQNVLFTQNWVLQLLWVVCGISWSLTRRGASGYVLRLGMYFIVGACLNWLAWVAKGKDWQHDIEGTIYQMFFILGLMIYVVFTSCIKPMLLRGNKQHDQALDEALGGDTLGGDALG